MPVQPKHTLTITNTSANRLKVKLVAGNKTINGSVPAKNPNKPQIPIKTMKFKEQEAALPLKITAGGETKADIEISGKADATFNIG